MPLAIPRKDKTALGVSHQRAPQMEAGVAKRLNARTTKASGAKNEKGDVRKNGVFRVECKTTQQKSYSVTRETFYKLLAATCSYNEIPILNVEFLNDNGQPECELAILPMHELEKLLNR